MESGFSSIERGTSRHGVVSYHSITSAIPLPYRHCSRRTLDRNAETVLSRNHLDTQLDLASGWETTLATDSLKLFSLLLKPEDFRGRRTEKQIGGEETFTWKPRPRTELKAENL